MKRRTFIAAFAAVAALSGCASLGLGGFKQPVVTFKDLRVAGVGLTGGSLDVYLNVYNPNGFKLDATRLTYNLAVGSQQVANGALDSRFTVQKGDSTTVRIPVNFSYTGANSVLRQMMGNGSTDYRVTGDVTVGTPVGNYTIPYDRTGRFSVFAGAR